MITMNIKNYVNIYLFKLYIYAKKIIKILNIVIFVYIGILILFISGMHIAWGIWRTDFYGEWLEETSDINFIIIITSWYISSIFGYIIGSYLIQHLKKKKIYVSYIT